MWRERRPAGCRGTQACAIVFGSTAGLYVSLELVRVNVGCAGCAARGSLCGALTLANRARTGKAGRLWGCGQLLLLLRLGRGLLAGKPDPPRPRR